jgi:RNA polymerase sigma-B factor
VLQVACVALVRAIDRFDPSRGVAFSSYALPTMYGEVKRYYRDKTWAVRPGFELADARASLDPLLARLSGRDREVLRLRFEDDLTQREIGERLCISQMQVSRILRDAIDALADDCACGSEGSLNP